MNPRQWSAAALGIVVSTWVVSPVLADTKAELDVGVHETLKAFDALNTHNRHLLKHAAGALVFPRVTKGGAGIAGEYGEGALRVDGKTVAYYSLSAASIGLKSPSTAASPSWIASSRLASGKSSGGSTEPQAT